MQSPVSSFPVEIYKIHPIRIVETFRDCCSEEGGFCVKERGLGDRSAFITRSKISPKEEEGNHLELLGKVLPLLGFIRKGQNRREVYLNCHDYSSNCSNWTEEAGGYGLVLILLIVQGMEFVIVWKTVNQFQAGLSLMTGLYLLTIAGMVSLFYLKRWLNN